MNSPKKLPKGGGHVPDFAPGSISDDTARKYFESGSQPRIERNRWFLISILMAIVLILNAFGFNALLPLKTVETLKVSQEPGGRLVVDPTPVGRWEADKDNIAYFINQWGINVFDVNRSTIERTTAEASSLTIGNAVGQLRDLRTRDNPMLHLRDNPNFGREYEYRSINFIKDDVALLRFKTITRKGEDVTTSYYAMTITFTQIKPKTREQVIRNPAGLFITNFNITEEVVAK